MSPSLDSLLPLFVSGDRPERFEKVAGAGADAVIIDLEGAVAAKAKDKARAALRADLVALPVQARVRVSARPGTRPTWLRRLALDRPEHDYQRRLAISVTTPIKIDRNSRASALRRLPRLATARWKGSEGTNGLTTMSESIVSEAVKPSSSVMPTR